MAITKLSYAYGEEPGSFDLDGSRFIFYREHFNFGKFPAYKTADGKRFRFLDRGDILTGAELASKLRPNTWEGESELRWLLSLSD